MEIGLIGLGTMGVNMGQNLVEKGHTVLGYDIDEQAREEAMQRGLRTFKSIDNLVSALQDRKIILLSVPAGDITDEIIESVSKSLNKNDIIVDTGNSFYKDSIHNYQKLKKQSIHFLDCGTSGGMEGSRHGACLMIGGEKEVFEYIELLFRDIATEKGYLYTGGPGSGHYAKMVHNGIEYGMMQAIGEGFEILNESDYEFDHEAIADVWSHGSVIRSWLMELACEAFSKDPNLDTLKGVIGSSGTGKWTVEEALELKVPTPVISSALNVRYQSEIENSYSARVVAQLRHGFGGHSITKS